MISQFWVYQQPSGEAQEVCRLQRGSAGLWGFVERYEWLREVISLKIAHMICCYLSIYMYIHVYIMSCIEVNIMLASFFLSHIKIQTKSNINAYGSQNINKSACHTSRNLLYIHTYPYMDLRDVPKWKTHALQTQQVGFILPKPIPKTWGLSKRMLPQSLANAETNSN